MTGSELRDFVTGSELRDFSNPILLQPLDA